MIHLNIQGKPQLKVYAKLESYNPTGSVKDRAAYYLFNYLLEQKVITKSTTVIESSSGNFGVALSAYARLFGIKFICVIDKNTLPINEQIIRLNGAEVICIDKPDNSGGYLSNRIAKVREIVGKNRDIYWVNQYENPLNAQAYYKSLGQEICREMPGQKLNYIFMGLSSGGTITGTSNRIKECFPNAQVIAVDVEGSVIFGRPPKKRFIPGIGSSIQPKILNQAKIDDVVYVNESETIQACRSIFDDYSLIVGGSSGSVFAAVKKYFKHNEFGKSEVNIVCVFADSGDKYLSTLYNQEWCNMVMSYEQKLHQLPQNINLELK